jgi:hypothetical protein
MKREEIEKLLGGYAAGTLTNAERQALFAAALEDQHLFDVLAREEPLRELLQDPAARGELLATLDDAPQPWYYRPLSPAIITGAAAALIAFALVVYWRPLRTRIPVDTTPVKPQIATVPPGKAFGVLPDGLRPRPVRSSLPAELPPPPVLAPAASSAALQKLAETPAAPPPPEPAPAAAQASAPADATTQLLRAALSALPPAAPRLRYRIMRRLPNGEFAEVDPQQELEREDAVVIRLEVSETGYAYVFQQDVEKQWQPLATARVLRAGSYLLPPTGSIRADTPGSKEFLLVFSRVPLSNARGPAIALSVKGQEVIPAASPGRATAVVTTAAEPPAQQVSFPITLKYK